jgi:hypothetical protein
MTGVWAPVDSLPWVVVEIVGTVVLVAPGATIVVVTEGAPVAIVAGEADGELLHPAIPMARPTSTAATKHESRTRLRFTTTSLARVRSNW